MINIISKKYLNIRYKSTTGLFSVITASVFFLIFTGSPFAFQSGSSVLTFGELSSRIKNITPLSVKTLEEKFISGLIFGDPLYKYDPNTNSIVKGIVETDANISVNSYILGLKQNVSFSDGSLVRAEDIRFSIDTYRQYTVQANISYNGQLDKIERIETIGNSYLRIYLNGTIFDHNLMLLDIPVLSKNYYEGENLNETINNIATKTPMGYGAYNFTNFTIGSGITLVRNINYFDGIPDFRIININLYSDITRIKNDFITGRLDFIQVYNNDHYIEIERTDTAFQVIPQNIPIQSVYFIDFNRAGPILSSSNVRKALNSSLQKTNYTESDRLFKGRDITYGPIPPNHWAHYDDLEKIIFRARQAVRDLRREGWQDRNRDAILDKGNQTFSVELIFTDDEPYLQNLARNIKSDLGNLNIEVNLIQTTPLELRQRIRSNNYQMALDVSNFYPYDIIRSFKDLFDLSGQNFQRNRLGNRNGETYRLLDRAKSKKTACV